jgi:1,4-dihydroxy-2-naphthoate octaprenyltransferase
MENPFSRNESSAELSEPVSNAGSWRDAFVLMRIPFSVFLMPVFWFALSNVESFDSWRAFWIFIIIHIFLYPASNGYNSYFDRDESSIGGLKEPPQVGGELFRLVMLFDAIAILGAWFITPLFAMMVLVYTLVSKAYSFDRIRLKRFPVISTTVVTVFQGAFTYGMILIGLEVSIDVIDMVYAATSTLLISGSYPLTQIYQHEEDEERGDKTLSLMLGIKGTFLFSAFMFLLGFGALMTTYALTERWNAMGMIGISSAPIAYYFIRWMWLSWKDEDHVNFRNTMNMNAIASLCLSAGFILILMLEHYF